MHDTGTPSRWWNQFAVGGSCDKPAAHGPWVKTLGDVAGNVIAGDPSLAVTDCADDEECMLVALHRYGPLAVIMESTPLQFHGGGMQIIDKTSKIDDIINRKSKHQDNGDGYNLKHGGVNESLGLHSVNVVGYGEDPQLGKYWSVLGRIEYVWLLIFNLSHLLWNLCLAFPGSFEIRQ